MWLKWRRSDTKNSVLLWSLSGVSFVLVLSFRARVRVHSLGSNFCITGAEYFCPSQGGQNSGFPLVLYSGRGSYTSLQVLFIISAYTSMKCHISLIQLQGETISEDHIFNGWREVQDLIQLSSWSIDRSHVHSNWWELQYQEEFLYIMNNQCPHISHFILCTSLHINYISANPTNHHTGISSPLC